MRVIVLLDNQLASVQGQWFNVDRWLNKTLNITGLLTTGGIQVCVSGRDAPPLNTEDEFILTPAYAAADINKPITITQFVAWMKVNKTNGGAGTGNTRVTLLVPDTDDSIA